MNLVKVISICLLLCGCTAKVEYRDVYIPTKVEIDKPTRPIYTKEDNTYSYLIKVLGYTKKLEIIVNEVTK